MSRLEEAAVSEGRASFTEQTVVASDVSISVLHAGQGSPVLYVSCQEATAHPIADRLAAEFRLVVVKWDDIVSGPQSGSSARINGLLSALDLQSCAVVAENGGALAALHLLTDQPEKIDSLVLLEPDIIGDNDVLADPELGRKLHSATSPVLAIFGTDPAGASPTPASAYRQIIPSCHLIYLYDAENITGDRPEAAASVIADFLRRGEDFLISDRDGRIHP